jgi:hypothetical protein
MEDGRRTTVYLDREAMEDLDFINTHLRKPGTSYCMRRALELYRKHLQAVKETA